MTSGTVKTLEANRIQRYNLMNNWSEEAVRFQGGRKKSSRLWCPILPKCGSTNVALTLTIV